MTFEYRRVSMNTSLKNARIFDDDSWESDDLLSTFKNEPKIKKEPVDNDDTNQSWMDDSVPPPPRITAQDIKQEKKYVDCSWFNDNVSSFPKIKQEPFDYDNEDTSKSWSDNAPPPPRITPLNFDENAVASPIKQERIDFETKLTFDTDESLPGTNGNTYDGYTSERKETRVNLKRRIGSCIKQDRDEVVTPSTPKKRHSSTSSMNSSPESKKFKGDQKRKKKKEVERDPVVLKRRQKQIDYGKNTIGYDRYITLIPKHKRASGDPQTPDKYRKYSRRGWDGLIKHWRLKLHHYDPVEEGSEVKQE
ncbi:hypothetical protein AMK59_3350 [Oryctes borbonicus]|uniref:Histone RNA hairpin-binding protein RNA-binding domain-containing protein n=1 Tax=Oryctes borbonicus TaxID=1629725 RepID=A0A0T6B770_9SCAR|nr:hypothetical protein AMK59_3350 [Oryctes borbonicus]